MKKMLGFIALTLLIVFSNIASVSAIDKTVIYHNRALVGVEKYKNAGTSYKYVTTTAGNRIAYCFNKALNAPPDGSTLTLNRENTTAAIIYVLDNGYGGTWNSALLGNGLSNDQRYYVTQLALWMVQGSLSPSSLNANGTIGKPALALYNAALKNTVAKPSISISNGGTMSLSKDGKYYESKNMTVKGSGFSKYTVTLVNAPADVKIYTSNGETKSNGASLNAGTKFKVRIPVEKVSNSLNVKVKVAANGLTKKVYIYKYVNSKYQDIGLLFNETTKVKAETSVTLSPLGSLKVIKVDVSNGTEKKLSNVKLTVKNSAGKVIATWVTNDTNNPYVINNLPLGTYTIIEEVAPAGYIKASNINVTVKPSKTVEVKVQNSKTPSPVEISKQDATTKAELPGAHLVLKNAVGQVVDQWVSTTTPHIVRNLTPGKYILSETIAPEGYIKTTETVSFVIEANGGVTKKVVMYNTKTTPIKISKQDITTKKELPGAKLVLKNSAGEIVDQWVSTTQPHYITKKLPAGKYTLIETIAPKGYGISDEVIEFEVNENGEVAAPVIMYNSPIPVTADMNLTLIVAGLVGTVALAGFSIFKLNQQHV